MTTPVNLTLIGTGGMARHHTKAILKQLDTTQVTVVCEPSPQMYAAFADLYTTAKLTPPPNEPNLERLLDRYKPDAAFIITPHVYHFEQTKACLEAGLDVLLEKPMVMTAAEAIGLIETRDRTGRLLVVAFPGSLSPQVREASRLLRSGELGQILNIDALAWQDWAVGTTGTWRQDPAISGGGFLFDTGAHMLNTA